LAVGGEGASGGAEGGSERKSLRRSSKKSSLRRHKNQNVSSFQEKKRGERKRGLIQRPHHAKIILRADLLLKAKTLVLDLLGHNDGHPSGGGEGVC